MQLTSFSLMHPINLFKKRYQIVAIHENKRLVLRSEEGIDKEWEIETLLDHYLTGNLKRGEMVARPNTRSRPLNIAMRLTADVSEQAKKEAHERRQYLDALERSGTRLNADSEALKKVLQEVSLRLGRACPPSISTIKRWRAIRRLKGDDPASLVPYFERRGGSGRSRLSPSADRAIEAVIDNAYMTSEKLSAQEIHGKLQESLAEANKWLPAKAVERIPSYSTILRRLQRRPAYELIASRQGAKHAERTYRSSSGSEEVFAFNECWEIDHTTLDLFVVDTRTGLPLGRPRFTAVIEYATRALMGFDLDFSGASAQATLNCLKHAMLPKTYLHQRYPKVQGEWPCFGLPQVLKCDNGLEFHSKSIKDACFELGIELQYCPVKQPWYKGRIERFFRTFNESALKGLPGATGSHYYKRAEDRDPAEFAVIDLQSLHAYLHVWIVDIYMPSNNRGIK